MSLRDEDASDNKETNQAAPMKELNTGDGTAFISKRAQVVRLLQHWRPPR